MRLRLSNWYRVLYSLARSHLPISLAVMCNKFEQVGIPGRGRTPQSINSKYNYFDMLQFYKQVIFITMRDISDLCVEEHFQFFDT